MSETLLKSAKPKTNSYYDPPGGPIPEHILATEAPIGPRSKKKRQIIQPAEGEDECLVEGLFGDEMTLPVLQGKSFLNMEWWDQVTWEELLTHSGITTRIVPDQLWAAIADLKMRIATQIEELDGIDTSTGSKSFKHGDQQKQERAWKLFFIHDLFLFGSLQHGTQKAKNPQTLVKQIGDRINDFNEGRWGALWAMIEHKKAAEDNPQHELETVARKVEELTKAGELSKAAAAVWGMAPMASGEQVKDKFEKSQKNEPPSGATTTATCPQL